MKQWVSIIKRNICMTTEETKTDIFHEKFELIRQINKFSPSATDAKNQAITASLARQGLGLSDLTAALSTADMKYDERQITVGGWGHQRWEAGKWCEANKRAHPSRLRHSLTVHIYTDTESSPFLGLLYSLKIPQWWFSLPSPFSPPRYPTKLSHKSRI